MRSHLFWTTALCATLAHGFQDSSPLFYFSRSRPSSSDLFSESSRQVASSASITAALLDSLSECRSDAYVLVSQPGVSSKDYAPANAAPHLGKRMTESTAGSWKAAISDVAGGLDATELQKVQRQLVEKCGADVLTLDAASGTIDSSDRNPQLIIINFASLPQATEERAAKLAQSDSYLNAVLNNLHPRKYTLIYTTTPASAASQRQHGAVTQHEPSYYYEADAEEPMLSTMHTDLKRDTSAHLYARQSESGNATNSDAALFEKYAFLSPGIFMGLLIVIILLSILYVGLSALSGLQITQFAFSKEFSGSSQKKQN